MPSRKSDRFNRNDLIFEFFYFPVLVKRKITNLVIFLIEFCQTIAEFWGDGHGYYDATLAMACGDFGKFDEATTSVFLDVNVESLGLNLDNSRVQLLFAVSTIATAPFFYKKTIKKIKIEIRVLDIEIKINL